MTRWQWYWDPDTLTMNENVPREDLSEYDKLRYDIEHHYIELCFLPRGRAWLKTRSPDDQGMEEENLRRIKPDYEAAAAIFLKADFEDYRIFRRETGHKCWGSWRGKFEYEGELPADLGGPLPSPLPYDPDGRTPPSSPVVKFDLTRNQELRAQERSLRDHPPIQRSAFAGPLGWSPSAELEGQAAPRPPKRPSPARKPRATEGRATSKRRGGSAPARKQRETKDQTTLEHQEPSGPAPKRIAALASRPISSRTRARRDPDRNFLALPRCGRTWMVQPHILDDYSSMLEEVTLARAGERERGQAGRT